MHSALSIRRNPRTAWSKRMNERWPAVLPTLGQVWSPIRAPAAVGHHSAELTYHPDGPHCFGTTRLEHLSITHRARDARSQTAPPADLPLADGRDGAT